MTTYYVYQLVNPRNGKPFYIGKGTGNRAWSHVSFQDGNNNPYKDRFIAKILSEGLEPGVEIIHNNITCEEQAYDLEEQLIRSIGLGNLTNICENARPPSRKGWKPSSNTLAKRSKSLKGISRTEAWRDKLSDSKKGPLNPMYGRKEPCTPERRAAVLRGKNQANVDLYKQFLLEIQTDVVSNVFKRLGVGKGVAYRLANGNHGIFEAFPELKELLLR